MPYTDGAHSGAPGEDRLFRPFLRPGESELWASISAPAASEDEPEEEDAEGAADDDADAES